MNPYSLGSSLYTEPDLPVGDSEGVEYISLGDFGSSPMVLEFNELTDEERAQELADLGIIDESGLT